MLGLDTLLLPSDYTAPFSTRPRGGQCAARRTALRLASQSGRPSQILGSKFEEPDGRVRAARSGDMNEATRRLLGVLLRQMDGFASANNRSVVVGATNRRQARSPGCAA